MIKFYVPKKVLNEGWEQEEKLHETCRNGGASWVVQTVLWLKKYSSEQVELVHSLPDKGIAVSHRCFIPDNFVPSKQLYLVCIQADWGRHIYAQHHVCQNPLQTQRHTIPLLYRFFWPLRTQFVHYWPQPNIIVREPSAKVETICFYGLKYNLAPELQSKDWQKFVDSLGLKWLIKEARADWNDYSDCDLVVFVRNFDNEEYLHKPATKLYNAWLAGSIPVHQNESAYTYEINQHPDCSVVVDDFNDLKAKLKKLCSHPEGLQQIRENMCSVRDEYRAEAIAQEWVELLANVKQEYADWNKSKVKQKAFFACRRILFFLKHIFLKQKYLVD